MEEEYSPHDGEELTSNVRVAIKQKPMDVRLGFVHIDNIHNLRWDDTATGVVNRTPIFPYGFVSCDDIVDGEVGHSCRRGSGPHSIKVCVIKKYTHISVYNKLIYPLGQRPKNREEFWQSIQIRWED